MLTGDENIVDINFTVFWLIDDAKNYLFNIRVSGQNGQIRGRERHARGDRREPDDHGAGFEGRAKIEADTKHLLQHLLNRYGAGIEVTEVQLQRVDPPAPVIGAFRDVQSALADRARLRNVAQAYRNDIVPRARGHAVKIVQDAKAYRQEIIARAEGDAARFLSVYHAFKAAQNVTLERLYLETMERVLKNSTKVIIDKSAEGGSGVLPYLPLPALGSAGTAAAGNTAPAAGSQQPTPQSSAPAAPLNGGQP